MIDPPSSPLLGDMVGHSGTLNLASVHGALRSGWEQRDSATIDLRRVSWFEPGGLVAVATHADGLVQQGAPVYVHGPSDPNVARYASRMRLGALLDQLGVEHDLEPVHEWRTAGRLLELRRFDGEADIAALAVNIFDLMAQRDERAAGALYESICEIGANVPQHSGHTHGYAAAQTTGAGAHNVQFAVGDSGRGFAAGMAALDVTTEGEALDAALNGVSRIRDDGRGLGIPSTRNLLNGLGGHLHLVSGPAARLAFKAVERAQSYETSVRGTLLQGTVSVTL